jgi:hypothetical protein
VWFFADGTETLICVHTNAPTGSKEFYNADAERFTARRGWGPLGTGLNLASEAINSGDYLPVSTEEAERVMAAMQQRIGEGR